jgi:hypothetical protein
MFAFDPSYKAVMGQRARQWTTVHPTQLGVVRELREGRWPTPRPKRRGPPLAGRALTGFVWDDQLRAERAETAHRLTRRVRLPLGDLAPWYRVVRTSRGRAVLLHIGADKPCSLGCARRSSRRHARQHRRHQRACRQRDAQSLPHRNPPPPKRSRTQHAAAQGPRGQDPKAPEATRPRRSRCGQVAASRAA